MTQRNIFKYPGSKTRLADWIISQFPDHERYVEAFGGTGSVLLHKPQSTVEVYNDIDSDLVQFFQVLRDRGDELAEWYECTPYSRELHSEWKEAYKRGYRPADPVERAGRFVFLRTVSINGNGGFSTRLNDRDPTNAFQSQPAAIREYSVRMQSVVIEDLDYTDLVEKYDGSGNALFYFDPPYPDASSSLYTHGSIDHEAFAAVLNEMDSDWIVSYRSVPAAVRAVGSTTLGKETRNNLRNGSEPDTVAEDDTEHLVCSFDPDERTQLSSQSQTSLQTF